MKKRVVVAVSIFCILLMLMVVSVIDSLDHSYSDEPVESDLIVMLGGDAGRMEKVAELYKEGYSKQVLITPVVESEASSQSSALAMEYGIPKDALILDTEAESTYSNATVTMEVMEERNMDSALVVTSDYHIKRAKYIFDRVNEGRFSFRYIAALENGNRWYEADGAFYAWRTEYLKLWWYRFGLYHLTG
ncbi:YdcF family protein [Salinicoccus sesuvii]|uniref:YdcF family protein n=1 Tax=Salinicoccus sesuvii TaxID=868281 RepID=A0ABV7N659_9STAP